MSSEPEVVQHVRNMAALLSASANGDLSDVERLLKSRDALGIRMHDIAESDMVRRSVAGSYQCCTLHVEVTSTCEREWLLCACT